MCLCSGKAQALGCAHCSSAELGTEPGLCNRLWLSKMLGFPDSGFLSAFFGHSQPRQRSHGGQGDLHSLYGQQAGLLGPGGLGGLDSCFPSPAEMFQQHDRQVLWLCAAATSVQAAE